MKVLAVILCIVVFFLTKCDAERNMKTVVNETECPNLRSDLNFVRKKRHLTFPDGSDIVLTISLVKAFMTHAPAGWNIALEIDVLFPLPDAKYTNAQYRKKLHHRQKREFWDRLKHAMQLHNIDGHNCILRSVCEAQTYLAPKGKSLVHDILRAVFTVSLHEEEFRDEFSGAYNEVLDPNLCEHSVECPFSILNFVMEFNKKK